MMNDLKEPNNTTKKIIDQYNPDFFKTSRSSNIYTKAMLLNLVNPVNNTRYDPRENLVLYTLKTIQKYNVNKYPGYLFIKLDGATLSELISENNVHIIQLLKICRHMHISCAICVQNVRERIEKLKRLIWNVLLYDYLT
jgi:hypothetical protein